MKVFGIVVLVLLGLPALLWIVGSFLPRDHVARMTLELRSPPERVWALVSDVGGTARWRDDVTTVDVQTGDGPLRFVETTKNGKMPFELVSQEAPRRQVVRVVDEGQPFGGRWTWNLEPLGEGTRLTVEEAGFIRNPIFRVMAKLFFPPTRTIEIYLRALAKELGESAVPRA